MAEELRILEQEYCPPIDPALVHAIYSDYADTPGGVSLARALLDNLKLSANAEQFTDFDPSGSSGDGGMKDGAGQRSDDAESNVDTWASRTTITESTSLSNELSTLSIGERSGYGSEESLEGGRGAYFKESENFDTSTKELMLAETFPTLRPELCARTLKKCNNDLSKATDELLNHVYFEDSRASPSEEVAPVAKGIDAFSDEYHVPQRGKRGKAKRRQQKSAATYFVSPGSTLDAESPTAGSQPVNRWANSSKDVEFITTRTSFSAKTVSSLYHENGASRSATILALVKKDLAKHKSNKEPDANLVQPAINLVVEFPTIDLEYAIALVRLAAPSEVKAKELADALTAQPATEASLRGDLKVIPRYAPVNISDSVDSESTNLPELPASVRPRDSAALATARSDAFTKASSAYRKGKSTPLMKAAAGYYAQVGRDLNANLKAINEIDADTLVSLQSGSTYLDLHGVSVNSATRIAIERTQAWWDGLGEQRIPGGGRAGVGGGYRIITGLGRHSEGGRGKIGPAVVKALVGDGWKIEVGSGELVVVGVARRA